MIASVFHSSFCCIREQESALFFGSDKSEERLAETELVHKHNSSLVDKA